MNSVLNRNDMIIPTIFGLITFSRTAQVSLHKCKRWTWYYNYANRSQVKVANSVDTSLFAKSAG